MAGLCPCHASGWSRASGGSALPHPWLFLHKSAEVFLLTCIPVCCSERGSDGQHGCRNCYVISLQYKLQRKHAPHTIMWCCISQNILVEEGYFFCCCCCLFRSRCPKLSVPTFPHDHHHVTQGGTNQDCLFSDNYRPRGKGQRVEVMRWFHHCCPPQGLIQFWACGSVLFVLLPGVHVWAPQVSRKMDSICTLSCHCQPGDASDSVWSLTVSQ